MLCSEPAASPCSRGGGSADESCWTHQWSSSEYHKFLAQTRKKLLTCGEMRFSMRAAPMKKFVSGIRQSDFRLFRQAGYSYVDKSSLISEILADSTLVLLFQRPRRFGKTISLSMLKYFFDRSNEDLSHLFEGLRVWKDERAKEHFQKHPVISVSFKDVKADSLSGVLAGIRDELVGCFDQYRHLLEENKLDPTSADYFRRMLSHQITDDQLPYCFKWLSHALHRHYGERVVILIDEYDTPIQSGYLHDFFDKIVLFFRIFFTSCLKDNASVFKGVLTGILRVAKENMFSGLNHIETQSIIDEPYADAFGFTEDEVAAIVPSERLEEVRSWYNGYLFGGKVIYNPWSILHFIKYETLKPYWVNSGSSDLIEHLAAKRGLGLTEKSEALLRGEAIEVQIDSNIVLRDIHKNDEALWNFLLFSGYLKPVQLDLIEGRYFGKLAIPNREVKIVYEEMFRKWLYEAAPERAYVDNLVKALFSGETETMQEILEEILLHVLSFQDEAGRQPEKLYHGLILGLLVHLQSVYDIRSNRESGYGRADVLMRPKAPGKPGAVIEFKVVMRKETPAQAMLRAAEQVRTRNYAEEVRASGASPVYEYVMVFDGKHAFVQTVDELLKKAAKKKAATTKSSAKKVAAKKAKRN